MTRSRSRRTAKSRWRSDGRDPLVADLVAALSADRVRADSTERALYAHDASVFEGGLSGPVCFPVSTQEVQAIIRISADHGRAIVPRGAGTGVAGAAIPLGAPVMVVTTRMNRILGVDVPNRAAHVEPGVINLDLSKHLAPYGYHYAPDPSSQQACTIGGNIANNSGGPHCLAYGVTSNHVLAVEVVLPDGEIVQLGGLEAEPDGYDLRGAFVGGEGTLGIATRISVRITPDPPAVKTLLLAFDTVEGAASTVSAVISEGIVPAAMEVMDRIIVEAVEKYVQAGYPTSAAAVLLVDVEGMPAAVEADAARLAEIGKDHGATSVRIADHSDERALLWKGRKTAFGAIAQLARHYYLLDTVVPRSALVEVLARVYEIADSHQLLVVNLFHAGDGNLHPVLLFDRDVPGVMERVHAAGSEIVRVSLEAGGSLTGEHGIGIEKQEQMHLMFGDDDLDHQERLRRSFDPTCRSNPGKIIPSSHSCADIQALRRIPTGVWA